MNIKASTMIEILVVMIISGIVIGLTFEGMDIFRRFSGKVAGEIVKTDGLFSTYTSLNTIVGNSDSLTLKNDTVGLYRKRYVFGNIYTEDSKLIIRILNNSDTLPVNVESLKIKSGTVTDTLFVETEKITLYVCTKERAVITTEKNKYYETQDY